MTLRKRAFVLTEMLVAIALLAIFAAAATPLMRNTFRLMWQAEAERNRIAQSESMLRLLRQDVWSAEQVETIAGGIELYQSGQPIRWTLVDATTMQRQETGRRPLRWPAPAGSRLQASPAGAVLRLSDAGDDAAVLVSQLQLLKRESAQ